MFYIFLRINILFCYVLRGEGYIMKPKQASEDKNNIIRDLFNNFSKIAKNQKEEEFVQQVQESSESTWKEEKSSASINDDNSSKVARETYSSPYNAPQRQEEVYKQQKNDSILQLNESNKDKFSLDLVASVEQIIKDRHILKLSISDLESKLSNEKENSNRLRNEKMILEKYIDEKDMEVERLENKITDKQLNFEQLMEDYKELQSSSSTQVNELKYAIDKENSRYESLSKDYNAYKAEKNNNQEKLEEEIRELKAENEKLYMQYKSAHEDKAKLLQTINDFTSHMSSSFKAETSSFNNREDQSSPELTPYKTRE